MIDRDKIMVVAGDNIMRKTPQETYDLIDNMTQHHYQWESKVQYDTTTYISAHYSKTTFASSEQVEVLGNDTGYTIQSVQHQPGPVQNLLHPLSGSPTPPSDSIIVSPSPSLTPLGNSDFLLEETDAFLALDSIPLGIDNEIFDAEGDILLLEKLLNIDSTKDLPLQELNNDSEGDILFFEKLLEDELSEAKKCQCRGGGYKVAGQSPPRVRDERLVRGIKTVIMTASRFGWQIVSGERSLRLLEKGRVTRYSMMALNHIVACQKDAECCGMGKLPKYLHDN
ncbi:hypothetical protein Tco_0303028 [Tanacetum coccineum]